MLATLLTRATKSLHVVEDVFERTSRGTDQDLLALWEAASVAPKRNAQGEVESVYHLQAKWDQGACESRLDVISI